MHLENNEKDQLNLNPNLEKFLNLIEEVYTG